MKTSTRYVFVALICFNFALCVAATMLEAGYHNTPYGTRDSKGNPLGFNDPITLELYGIMFRNTDLSGFFKTTGWYTGLYMLMQFLGLKFVMTARKLNEAEAKWRMYYFLLQPVLFPAGWLGLLLLPVFLLLGADGETISDGIPLGWIFQPLWFAIFIGLAVVHSKIVVRSKQVTVSAVLLKLILNLHPHC